MSKKTGLSSPTTAPQPLRRRGLLVGVGVAGAAALAVKTLPGTAPAATATVASKAVVDSAGGYQLTQHVLRYYETART